LKARRACVVGKGPTIREHRNVDADLFISGNEAIYEVGHGVFTRYDMNTRFFRFCIDLPEGVIPIVPQHIRFYYPEGYWFTWLDVNSAMLIPTTICGIHIAAHLGAREIILCGVDALRGDTSYDPAVANVRNTKYGLGDQRVQFQGIREDIRSRCSFFDGQPLNEVLWTPN
jgi:hypothetical protein